MFSRFFPKKQRGVEYISLYKFEKSRPDELSLDVGHIVYVVESDGLGWMRGSCQSKSGWFPSSYVQDFKTATFNADLDFSEDFEDDDEGEDDEDEDDDGTDDQSESDENEELYSEIPALLRKNRRLSKTVEEDANDEEEEESGIECRALFNYEPQQSCELSLKEGWTVWVVEAPDTGWWRGFINENAGWFPTSYVEPVIHHEQNPNISISEMPVPTPESNMSSSSRKSSCIQFAQCPTPDEAADCVEYLDINEVNRAAICGSRATARSSRSSIGNSSLATDIELLDSDEELGLYHSVRCGAPRASCDYGNAADLDGATGLVFPAASAGDQLEAEQEDAEYLDVSSLNYTALAHASSDVAADGDGDPDEMLYLDLSNVKSDAVDPAEGDAGGELMYLDVSNVKDRVVAVDAPEDGEQEQEQYLDISAMAASAAPPAAAAAVVATPPATPATPTDAAECSLDCSPRRVSTITRASLSSLYSQSEPLATPGTAAPGLADDSALEDGLDVTGDKADLDKDPKEKARVEKDKARRAAKEDKEREKAKRAEKQKEAKEKERARKEDRKRKKGEKKTSDGIQFFKMSSRRYTSTTSTGTVDSAASVSPSAVTTGDVPIDPVAAEGADNRRDRKLSQVSQPGQLDRLSSRVIRTRFLSRFTRKSENGEPEARSRFPADPHAPNKRGRSNTSATSANSSPSNKGVATTPTGDKDDKSHFTLSSGGTIRKKKFVLQSSVEAPGVTPPSAPSIEKVVRIRLHLSKTSVSGVPRDKPPPPPKQRKSRRGHGQQRSEKVIELYETNSEIRSKVLNAAAKNSAEPPAIPERVLALPSRSSERHNSSKTKSPKTLDSTTIIPPKRLQRSNTFFAKFRAASMDALSFSSATSASSPQLPMSPMSPTANVTIPAASAKDSPPPSSAAVSLDSEFVCSSDGSSVLPSNGGGSSVLPSNGGGSSVLPSNSGGSSVLPSNGGGSSTLPSNGGGFSPLPSSKFTAPLADVSAPRIRASSLSVRRTHPAKPAPALPARLLSSLNIQHNQIIRSSSLSVHQGSRPRQPLPSMKANIEYANSSFSLGANESSALSTSGTPTSGTPNSMTPNSMTPNSETAKSLLAVSESQPPRTRVRSVKMRSSSPCPTCPPPPRPSAGVSSSSTSSHLTSETSGAGAGAGAGAVLLRSSAVDVSSPVFLPEIGDADSQQKTGDGDSLQETGDGGSLQPTVAADSQQKTGDGDSLQETGDGGSPQPTVAADSQQKTGDGGSLQETGDGGSLQPTVAADSQQKTGDAGIQQKTGDADRALRCSISSQEGSSDTLAAAASMKFSKSPSSHVRAASVRFEPISRPGRLSTLRKMQSSVDAGDGSARSAPEEQDDGEGSFSESVKPLVRNVSINRGNTANLIKNFQKLSTS